MDPLNASIMRSLDAYMVKWSNAAAGAAPLELTVEVEAENEPLAELITKVATRTLPMMNVLYPNFVSVRVYAFDTVPWVATRLNVFCPSAVEWVALNGAGLSGCGKLVTLRMPDVRLMYAEGSVMNGIPHEMFHAAMTNAMFESPGYWALNVPSWLREGAAQLAAGMVTALMRDERDPHYGLVQMADPESQKLCAAAYESWRTDDSADGHEQTNYCEYGLGRIMTEVLVAHTGTLATVTEMYRDTGMEIPFAVSFEKRSGMTKAAFFAEVDARLRTLGWSL